MDNGIIGKYFPNLTPLQYERFTALYALYTDWNAKINVISRKDMEHFHERHVLHSLAIAMVCAFEPGARIMDVGSGGGFPGIPLAILFPECSFTLVDSIGKKVTVISNVIETLGLNNVSLHEKIVA
jgi:16S rRNA (guanine527-N7)-methyltransferase